MEPTNFWRGHPRYECPHEGCPFDTLEPAKLTDHLAEKHPPPRPPREGMAVAAVALPTAHEPPEPPQGNEPDTDDAAPPVGRRQQRRTTRLSEPAAAEE